MNARYDEILDKLSEFLKSETKTETVIGNSFKLGEYTCVPVIRVGMGMGFGEGIGESVKSGKADGGGGGAGFGIEPMGFLVTIKDEISFIPAKANKGLSAAIEKAPELLEKYFENVARMKNEKTETV